MMCWQFLSHFIFLINLIVKSQGGGTQYKDPGGCAANMGSKISLLVYEWPLVKCKIWYVNGAIFQNFPKFQPKLAQIEENLGKI